MCSIHIIQVKILEKSLIYIYEFLENTAKIAQVPFLFVLQRLLQDYAL